MLQRCNGNKREACRTLDISYHTLQSYLRFPVHDPDTQGATAPDSATAEQWGTDAAPDGEVEVESMV